MIERGAIKLSIEKDDFLKPSKYNKRMRIFSPHLFWSRKPSNLHKKKYKAK
jgi:hypothetical protein